MAVYIFEYDFEGVSYPSRNTNLGDTAIYVINSMEKIINKLTFVIFLILWELYNSIPT